MKRYDSKTKYCFFIKDELYDLKEDPFELENIVDNQNYNEVLIDMKNRLEK
ncbi:MAG: DUF4976 domain-containing protein [Candidatus Lokiarchaeota archaeon]|nr:DUF4976 domain-containing protein [Candidatus Lokiarchaeota archaeon]